MDIFGRQLTPQYLWRLIRRYSTQLGYCILVLLMLWGSLIAMFAHDYRQAVQEIEQNNDQFTRGLEEHVRRSLYAMDDQMQVIKVEYERGGVTPAISTVIDLARKNPLLVQILVLDSSGNIVTCLKLGEPGLNFADRSYFRVHIDSDRNQTYISEPIVGRITNKSAILMSRRLNAADGSFAGVVVMAVDPVYFSRFYQDMAFSEGRLVRIVGLDGIVRASWNRRMDEIGQNVKEGYLFSSLKQSPLGRYKAVGIYYEVDRFMSYRTMPDYPLIVQVGYETEPALEEYRERRDRLIVGRTAASIVIVVITGFAIANARRQRRKDERWQLVVEGVNDGIWDWDASTDKVFYADRCKAILGYASGDIGDSREEWMSRSHPEELEHVLQAIADHKEGRSAIYDETQRFRCKDGFYKWVRNRGKVLKNENGEIVRMIGAMTDIHAEKVAAEALRQSKMELRDSREKYQALIDQSFEAIAIIDFMESRQIVEVNARFTEWFGYSLPEDAPLTVDKILIDEEDRQESYYERLCANGHIPVEKRTYRHKNGSMVFMERSVSMVKHRERNLIMISYRNIADKLQQEQEMRKDAAIARQIQRALLSHPAQSEHVLVETVFRPCGEISGDLYHLEWRNDGQVLRGYLVDVPGQALTTALYTAALSVLLHEAAEMDVALQEQLCWLNRQIVNRFEDTVLVSAIGFELDLQARELRCVGAGINRFWRYGSAHGETVDVRGLTLGVHEQQVYSSVVLPLVAGDCLYFTTIELRGLLDLLPELPLENFQKMMGLLSVIAEEPDCRDDATAVCICIKSLPQDWDLSMWPKILKYNGYEDYRRLQGKIKKLLTEVTGQQHSLQEVAVNEALANALECRDGQSRSQKARLKINKIGNRLIVRVKTSRIGFAGNAVLRRLRSQPEDMFSFGEDAAMGRGIPLMLAMSNKMTYNADGTEAGRAKTAGERRALYLKYGSNP